MGQGFWLCLFRKFCPDSGAAPWQAIPCHILAKRLPILLLVRGALKIGTGQQGPGEFKDRALEGEELVRIFSGTHVQGTPSRSPHIY